MPRRKNVSDFRMIDGKRFRYYSWHGTKKAASEDAKRMRKDGYKVRIIPYKKLGLYCLYRR